MKLITDIDQLDFNKIYTYADYFLWRFKERVELIKGKIFKMPPAPTEQHQKISFNITRILGDYLNNKPCSVYYAPFDVRLPLKNSSEEKEIHTVVQPDIVVICDQSKIDEKGCLGTPDVVFEILSKSTLQKDLHEKYELYESFGVKEYWIVDPSAYTIQVNMLNIDDGKYIPGRLLTRGDVATSNVLQGLAVDPDSIFPLIVEDPVEPYGPDIIRI